MLYGFWYRALPSAQVTRDRLQKAMLLETPLVIGRDREGKPFALRDACPHRGMPLSCGQFDGQNLECSYHGWKFDAHSGQCQLIPSLTSDQELKVDRIYAGSYACEEHDDFIWVFIPEPPPPGAGFGKATQPSTSAPRVPTFGGSYKIARLSADLPCSVDHGIIGLMDPAHGPFVHQAWWWRSRHSIHEKQKNFEPIPMGFRMSAHTPELEQRSVQTAAAVCRRRFDHHDHRFCSTQLAPRNHSRRKVLVLKPDHGNANHAQPMPHRCGRVLEYFSLDAVRRVAAEICVCEVRRTRPPDNGESIRRIETQPASHADRRCRPSRKMVLPVESRISRIKPQWRRDEASHGRSGNVKVEKLSAVISFHAMFRLSRGARLRVSLAVSTRLRPAFLAR